MHRIRCVSVCLLDTTKTAEVIEVPFGVWTLVGRRNYVLDGVQILPGEGALLGNIIRHAPACPQ